jgi:hypothetical protein
MKASELRIGNWITDRGNKAWQIDCWENSTKVSAKEPIVGYFDFTKKPIYGHPLTEEVNFLKPIPLTEEWLLKFGFVKTIGWDDMVFWRQPDFDFNSFEIYETEKGYESPHDKLIEYVHTLQNCYYFHELTGKELTIKN